MNQISSVVVLVALLGLTAGCSVFEGNTLGETRIETTFQDNSVERMNAAKELIAGLSKLEPDTAQKVVSALTRPLPANMSLYDGKDKANVDWSVNVTEGTANYSANEVIATSPAQVKVKIAEIAGDDAVEAIENAFPDGVQGLIRALSGTF